MAYNPALPQNNAPVSSSELRAQLAGLKELIDQCPTTAQMNDALLANCAGSAVNVDHLSTPISNPPTQQEVASLQAKFNQLITALHRG